MDERERQRVARAAIGVAVLMLGQTFAGRAVRDGFFLSEFPATSLPAVMIAASVLSVGIALGSAKFLRRVSPARRLRLLFAVNAAFFGAEVALAAPAPRIAATLLYLHSTCFAAILISGFWSLMSERLDPFTAKRVMGRIGGGATFGVVLGGLSAWGGASALPITAMIGGLALVNATCALVVPAIGEPPSAPTSQEASTPSTLAILEESPYLLRIGLLVMLVAVADAVYDYVFKSRAASAFETDSGLVSFFALYYLGLGVVTFAVQSLLVRRSLQRFGLVTLVGVQPAIGCVLAPFAAIVPGLASVVALRGGTSVAEGSFYRSGYELLYTPVPPESKRATKAVVDVGADELGGIAGGCLALLVIGVFPQTADALLLSFGVLAGLAALAVTRELHRGYVDSLADRLGTHAIDTATLPALDATTSLTIANFDRSQLRRTLEREQSRSARRSVDRRQVREYLARHGRRSVTAGRDAHAPSADSAPVQRGTGRDGTYADALDAWRDLASQDPDRVERALRRSHPLPVAMVAQVVPLLGVEALAEIASGALRRVAAAHVGLLVDAALRRRHPPALRQRVCEILAELPIQRSASGLSLLLDDESFALRHRAAAGLLRIAQRNPSLRLDREQVLGVAEREARECQRLWRRRRWVSRARAARPYAESQDARRLARGLGLVLTLLLTVMDRRPLRLAVGALGGDAAQRGTGLEYLDNVLPREIKVALWPLIENRALAESGFGSEILSELEVPTPESADVSALRERIHSLQAQQQGSEGQRA